MKSHQEDILGLIVVFIILGYIIMFYSLVRINVKASDRIGCSDIKKIHTELNCEEIQKRFNLEN